MASKQAAQPRGILKRTGEGPMDKEFQWDEKNLDQNEREKVPRMKIDEPPTPYHLPEDDGAEELSEGELEAQVAATGPAPVVDMSALEEDDGKSGAAGEGGFAEARRRHYQMGAVFGGGKKKKTAKKRNMAEYLRKINAEWGTKGREAQSEAGAAGSSSSAGAKKKSRVGTD